MASPGYSLDTASTAESTNIFGQVSSGTGTVVFGGGSAGTTAALANITSNPWMLALAAAAVVGIVYVVVKYHK